MFCAFPLGYMAFSGITLFTTDVSLLAAGCLLSNLLAGLAPCLLLQESPLYLVDQRQNDSRVLRVARRIRSTNGLPASEELLAQLQADLLERSQAEQRGDPGAMKASVRGAGPDGRGILRRFFCTWDYFFQFAVLSLVGGMINCVYFAITLKISKLTAASVTVNGLIFASISLASTLLMLPFGAALPRKLLLWAGQLVILASCLLLLGFDLLGFKSGTAAEAIKGVITAGAIGGVMYALFTPYFYLVTELFPADLRGTANALINFFSLLLSMAAPFLFKFADDRGFNGIEATSVLGLVSLPLTFFLRETVRS